MKILLQKINKTVPLAAISIAAILILSSCENSNPVSSSYDYSSIDEINLYLDSIASAYPSITATQDVGTSKNGRTIKALVISSYSGTGGSPADLEMEPRIRLSGAIHGNEKVTTEVLLRFIDYLIAEYNKGTAEIVNLVNSRYIVIIPVINPDGYAGWSRYNGNGVDLNRNFSREWRSTEWHPGAYAFSEPESIAIKEYSLLKRFTSSITMHSGSVIVNMPFDYGYTTDKVTSPVVPVENSLVKHMGLVYSTSGLFYTNPDMIRDSDVDQGTIFGGYWYYAYGTMQDWSYLDAGCLDYTVEISDSFSPSTEQEIQRVYNYNRDSLVAFIKESGIGVYGKVTGDGTTGLKGVTITVKYNTGSSNGDLVIYSDSAGYYHRLLNAGSYDITYELTGYTSQTITVSVTDSSPHVQKDITLVPSLP